MDNKPSIITMTMIKNEADIIETFVRYTMNFASKMIIIDNGCTDNTIDILKKLIYEGYAIEIYYEAYSAYEQYVIENKYLYKIIEENICDFIIPLDADEFLSAETEVLSALAGLDRNNVTLVNWKTYVLKSLEDCKTSFFDGISHVRTNESKTFTKTIIPYNIVNKNGIYLQMGHHDIDAISDLKRVHNVEIFIAHFPVRSKEQIQAKVYQGVISQLASSYKKIIAFHWKNLYQEMQSGKFDLIAYSQNYALSEAERINPATDIKEEQLNLEWCKNIKCKYSELAIVDPMENIFHMTEIMSLRNLIKQNKQSNCAKILVYGTGYTAKEIFRYIDKNDFNIVAFIDSNHKMEFLTFEDHIIISPKRIKFIEYDILVIASKFYDEITEVLKAEGIDINKVRDRFYFLKERMKSI